MQGPSWFCVTAWPLLVNVVSPTGRVQIGSFLGDPLSRGWSGL